MLRVDPKVFNDGLKWGIVLVLWW